MRATIHAGLIVLLATAGAHAADEGETIVQAKEAVEAATRARKQKDADALGTAFARIVELHNGLEGADWRKKLRAAAGDVVRDKKCPELHETAISALEQMDDGDGVYAELKRFLPKSKDPDATELQVYAIGVIGELKSPKGSKYLLELAEKGQNLGARKAALVALGSYRTIGKVRLKVLKGLLEVLADIHPGDEPTDEVRTLWHELEEPLVKALDELTYKDMESGQKWMAWYGENKSKLKDVFKGVDAEDED